MTGNNSLLSVYRYRRSTGITDNEINQLEGHVVHDELGVIDHLILTGLVVRPLASSSRVL